MKTVTPFSGIVLAGGKSRRMGRDKRLIMYSGVSLLELSVNRLKDLADEVIVVTGEREDLDLPDVHHVLDVEKNRGPMAALLSGLCAMTNYYAIVTPVDTPLLSIEFLSYLKEKAIGYDMAIPRWKSGIEPLIGAYSKNVIPAMKDWIRKERRLAPHLFIREVELKVRFVEEEQIYAFGNPEVLFLNVNNEDDLRKVENAAEKGYERR